MHSYIIRVATQKTCTKEKIYKKQVKRKNCYPDTRHIAKHGEVITNLYTHIMITDNPCTVCRR